MDPDQHKVLLVNELFEKVLGHTPLNSQLSLRASCKRLHERITDRIAELQTPQECVIRPKIPELLKIVKCKHVEFIVQSIHGKGKHNFSYQIRRLVKNLKDAGIEHISITADRMFGDHALSRNEQMVDYEMIIALVKGDILNVTFDCAFDGMANDRTHAYEKFKEKLAKTEKDVRIAFRGERHIDRSWVGQRFRQSPNHPEYGVELVDIVDSRRREQELVFKKV